VTPTKWSEITLRRLGERLEWGQTPVLPRLALDDGDGRDAQGQLGQDRRLEDALRADQGDAGAVDREALDQHAARKDVAVPPGLLSQEGEGAQADLAVAVQREGRCTHPGFTPRGAEPSVSRPRPFDP
jgi:hypothetical protein